MIELNTYFRVWKVYQELWSSLDSNIKSPGLYIRSEEELCMDALHCLVGVPSLTFQWSKVRNYKLSFIFISLSLNLC